jgi:predicted  nucleic acid-binding Zn-ribbon protein
MISREDYLSQLQDRLDEWHAEIETLKQDVVRVRPEIRADLEKRIVDLRKQCDAASQKITEIRTAKDSGWESLRDGTDRMWQGLKGFFQETKEAFQKGYREGQQ